ncbi:MAG: iron complex outerrane recepter protein [Sphingomonadales bacterium]|jgi:iron complex outermembrane receptor protein|nr:iron complex outerrane recepter protein [Sphingomonadales bacterium]
MKKFVLLCATSALAIPSAAFAQSTGTVEAEKDAIIVTGTRAKQVNGVEVPDTSKTREVLNQEFIQRQTPGQTINETINQLPGVSFTNNDPFGSSGGTLIIRGFDNSRISETFDGIPLNDTGNYAIFSNQLLDPELIEQVNVSLGSTDVDSPTASATGSTVNFRTRNPFEEFAARIQGSYGTFHDGDFFRMFGVIDTGKFGPFGTRAYGSASMATNDFVYGHRGKIRKQQFNAKIYQPIGSNGDFISVAGHYNENRNNFGGSLPLRQDLVNCQPTPNQTAAQAATCAAPRVVGSAAGNRFPLSRDERDYTIARCQTNQVARPGLADVANNCGSDFEERYNPSNTGNIRVNSRFTLADGLILTVDPSFQYVKANGGGTVVGQEGLRDVNPTGGTATPNQCVATPNAANFSCQTGYIGGTPYFGRDLNGDGDRLDTVRVLAPSQTQTNRYGVIAGLRYKISETQSIRINYTFDRGRHRQTGETMLLQPNGEPFDVFPVNSPLADVSGNILQKRDRLSLAILNQVSGEYRGEFIDRRLSVNIGVRAPFFKRDLNNFCATSSASGFVECFSSNSAAQAAWLANNPTVAIGGGVNAPVQGPQRRIFKYNKILPNAGFVFDFTPTISLFANYSKGLQVPSTDNLYNSFFFPITTAQAKPKPETTDNFDVGLRHRSNTVMAQISGWYTIFQNRLATAYDPDLDQNVFRNLGTVHKYGVDGSIAWQAIPKTLGVYVYGSYLWSRIQDNVIAGECTATVTASCPAGSVGTPILALTKGKRESGAPVWAFGARVQANLGPVEIGIAAKRTGPRYVDDENLPLFLCTNATGGGAFTNVVDCPGASATPRTAALFQVYGAKVPAYTTVNLDVRVPLGWAGFNDDTYFQFNVSNLFDKFYAGNFGGQLLNTSVPFVQLGAPRAFIGTLVVGFHNRGH